MFSVLSILLLDLQLHTLPAIIYCIDVQSYLQAILSCPFTGTLHQAAKLVRY